VMPFLKKQNGALKRDLDDMKRTLGQLQAFYSKTEERVKRQAMDDLQKRHDEAVELGDVGASRKVLSDMDAMRADFTEKAPAINDDKPSEEALRAELNEWVEANDWYVTDDARRRYADFQADQMGEADKWPQGRKDWFAELSKRVETKFADKKPAVTNGVGNRPSVKGGKSYSDLPPDAKRQCDRFLKSIPGFTKDQYVRDYSWS
jgi:hypothetical protein